MIIKEYLREMGITSAELAKRMGCSPGAVSLMVNGNPTIEKLSEVAGALGCRVSDLLDEPAVCRVICPACGSPIELSVTPLNEKRPPEGDPLAHAGESI